MKVLVTGAAGFIGSAICRQLMAEGEEVVAVDSYLPLAWGPEAADVPGVHRLDVRDAAHWNDLLGGVDVVCHQAAMVGAGVSVADFPAYASNNDLGTAALLAAMQEREVDALVLASSMVVYGEGWYSCVDHGSQHPGPRPLAALEAGEFENRCSECDQPLGWDLVPETARLDPRGVYAASKVAQEHYANAWCRAANGRAIALRYHNVYGPNMPKDTPYAGVASLFRSSLEAGQPARVFEDGGQMRDFIHVDDIALANVAAMRSLVDREAGSWAEYNVCSGQPVSILEVATAMGAEYVVTGEYRPADVRHIVASPELAESELGFVAQISPAEGLANFRNDPLRG